jgi:hypothetical protein
MHSTDRCSNSGVVFDKGNASVEVVTAEDDVIQHYAIQH